MTFSVGVPAMVTVTGTLIPFPDDGLMLTAPVNGPAPCNAAGFTVTVMFPGKAPAEGVIESQFPLLLVTLEAVNVVTLALLLVTEIC